jgi:hypothetical protein
MKFYRVQVTGKANRWEWTLNYTHAKSVALEWAQASILNRDSHTVSIDCVNFSYRKYADIIDILNGIRPMERMYMISIDAGTVISEMEWKRRRRKHKDPVNTAAHPTHRHADWIQTIHKVPEYQAIIRSAPDPRSCHMAMVLAEINVSLNGYKVTPAIARYCWDWVNCKPRS